MKKSFFVFAFIVCSLTAAYFVCTSEDDVLQDKINCIAPARKNVGLFGKTVKGENVAAPKRLETEKKDVDKQPAEGETIHAVAESRNDHGCEEEAEKQVEMFDELTDRWSSDSDVGNVTMADIERFQAQFRRLPAKRKEECLQRALNLIPDENVMLLAGILFDKSQDRELIETTFNDILNRDESVKKPIMEQIFKDRTHPCWADVAWILDVTGNLLKTN